MLLQGLQLPLTTPFYADGRLNLRKLEHNVRAYSKTPVAGLAVLTEAGEPSMLSDEEIRQVLSTAIEAAAPEKVMLAGISRDSVSGTLAVAEYTANLGYDAVVVAQPSFLRGGNGPRWMKELLGYFQIVADRSAVPVVLSSTAGLLPLEAVVALAGHSRIIGLVDDDVTSERVATLKARTDSVKHEATVTSVFAAVTGRMLARQKPAAMMLSADTLTGAGAAVASAPPVIGIKTRRKTVGFQILAGCTTRMLDGLLAGAVGAVPPFAACAPQACYEVFAAWKDGDRGLAEEKQARLQAAATTMEDGYSSTRIKFGCDLNGYFGGTPRLPLLPLTGEEREEIERLMEGLRS